MVKLLKTQLLPFPSFLLCVFASWREFPLLSGSNSGLRFHPSVLLAKPLCSLILVGCAKEKPLPSVLG